jgi:hypothetical protein
MPMATVRVWTGAETKALRRAMRLSIRDFAAHLDVGVRTVARWEARGAGITLAPDSQGLLDTAFARVSDEVQQRFIGELAALGRRDEAIDLDRLTLASVEGTVQLPVLVNGRPVLVPLPAHVPGDGLIGFLTGFAEVQSQHVPLADTDAISPLDRRSLLKAGFGVTLWTALNPDEIRHVLVALENPRRNLDVAVVEYFGRQLDTSMTEDGTQGPANTLPAVLGLLVAVDRAAHDVLPEIRRELLSVAARIAEFAGWLYRDVHDPLRAGYWRDRATEWAQEAGDTAMQGYVLLKKAQAAYDERDALRMLTLSQAVRSGPWQLPVRVQAEAAQQEARGHAMLGRHRTEVDRNLDTAHHLLATAEDDAVPLGAHYNATLLRMQTAICHTEAGQPRKAAELYRQWLQDDDFSPRDFGYFSSLMASALALAGEPDEAAQIGLVAWPLAVEADSGRTKAELRKVLVTLQPWQGRASVRSLREAMSV